MNIPETVTAGTLAVSASGYAGLAAERLLGKDPSLVERFGEGAFRLWKENLTSHVQELASALKAGCSSGFARQVVWAKVAFESRGTSVEDLRASLQCLREILGEELPQPAATVAVQYVDDALHAMEQPSPPMDPGLTVETAEGRLAAQYLEQLLAGRRREALELVLGAVRKGDLGVPEAYLEVALRVQAAMGSMWHRNEVNVAEEHFVTATTRMLMHQLLGLAELAPPCERTVLTAAIAGDAHDVAVQVLADFFEMDGWTVVNLGADVPHADLAAAARDFDADLVALSVTLDQQRHGVGAAIAQVRESSQARILVGGAAFVGLEDPREAGGADGYPKTIQEAVRLGRQLVGLPARAG